jgi:NAD(P)-dependent dehydrogenase (short-subunit alcohol dehydrogenase family)
MTRSPAAMLPRMAAPLSILVTGGGRGIGRAIALRFAREGALAIAAARTRPEIEAVAEEAGRAGGSGLAVEMDVADLASVERGVARILERTGGSLDVLVNNAGAFSIQPFPELTPETWYRMRAVNLDGPFHVTRAAFTALTRSSRAHVFNVSSIAGLRAFPGNVAYCATKFGLRGFSDALRFDLADLGIRVSTVYPSATDTGIFDGVPGDWDRARMYRPEDVAERVWQAYRAPADADVSDIELPMRG